MLLEFVVVGHAGLLGHGLSLGVVGGDLDAVLGFELGHIDTLEDGLDGGDVLVAHDAENLRIKSISLFKI